MQTDVCISAPSTSNYH